MNGAYRAVATRCFRTLLRPGSDLDKLGFTKIAGWRVRNGGDLFRHDHWPGR
jgi:hypothetical protein